MHAPLGNWAIKRKSPLTNSDGVTRRHRGGKVGIVRHQQHGEAAFAGEFAQQFHRRALDRRIEARGRLVREQENRIDDQRPRDRHALQLAARDLAGRPIEQVERHRQPRQDRLDSRPFAAV